MSIHAGEDPSEDRVRIDKWLWATRFFKTRTLATEAVELGRVLLNDDRVKPARPVKIGDRLEIRIERGRFIIDILALTQVRGSAAVAQSMYRETDDSAAARATLREAERLLPETGYTGKGRPTKKARRQIGRFNEIDR